MKKQGYLTRTFTAIILLSLVLSTLAACSGGGKQPTPVTKATATATARATPTAPPKASPTSSMDQPLLPQGTARPTSTPASAGQSVQIASQVIDPSTAEVTVAVPNKISITVPKGAAPAGSQLTIGEIPAASLPADKTLRIVQAYDVKLGTLTQFKTPLKITLNYNPAQKSSSALGNATGVAYYNETLKRWAIFPDAKVDQARSVIQFETKHLTKIGWFDSNWLSGYTDYFLSRGGHFRIYWKDGEPPSDASYHSPNYTQFVSGIPHYIQDIGYYLDQAYSAYGSKEVGLAVPTGVVNVFVQKLQDNGDSSYFGYLNINSNIEGEKTWNLAQEVVLPKVVAHEFLHYVQDYYYMTTFGDYTTKWWLEATATQADRMAWPQNSSPFEAVLYANEGLTNTLERSWDDVKADPDWYSAGGFLTYLSIYRGGAKANIAELIKRGGDATDFSYFRTIVDNYLKTDLKSSGIGAEYADYIKWVYDGSGPIRLTPVPPTTQQNAPYIVPIPFTATDSAKKTATGTVPYLGVRVAKIGNTGRGEEGDYQIVARAVTLPASVRAYAYLNVLSQTNRTLLGPVSAGKEIAVTLPNSKGTKGWLDIVMINTSKDDPANVQIDVEPFGEVKASSEAVIKNQLSIFGVPDNPVTVRLTGTIKGNPGLRFEGTETYAYYAGWPQVLAFVYSIPATAAKDTLDFDQVAFEFSPSNKVVKIVGTKPNSQYTDQTTDATYTWVSSGATGWTNGPAKKTLPNTFSGAKPGDVFSGTGIVGADATRDSEGIAWSVAGGVLFNAGWSYAVESQIRNMKTGATLSPTKSQAGGGLTIAIRLVKR